LRRVKSYFELFTESYPFSSNVELHSMLKHFEAIHTLNLASAVVRFSSCETDRCEKCSTQSVKVLQSGYIAAGVQHVATLVTNRYSNKFDDEQTVSTTKNRIGPSEIDPSMLRTRSRPRRSQDSTAHVIDILHKECQKGP
jgi:hypothetical protein